MEVEHLLDEFLSLSDLHSLSLDLYFENLIQSMPTDSNIIDRALKMQFLLLDAAKNSSRKRASNHNSLTMALPPDLTFKDVLSAIVLSLILVIHPFQWQSLLLPGTVLDIHALIL
ncbi:uncharacterized protein [Cicer arietinum]|uniref:uncharacterized protein n=1 Tax=Cicer arietinum TaxID=3827 RepID=UPI003CC69BA1